MIDKETLIGLLIETLDHWDENIETFRELDEEDSQDDWYHENCYGEKCSLCSYKGNHDIKYCSEFCPLDAGNCCIEWQNLHSECRTGSATIEDVEAMRNRIQRELDKLTADVD